MPPHRWKTTLLLLVAVSTLLAVAAAPPQSSTWKPLFNGKDLTGWKHVGPGSMTVEDGLIRTHGGMGLLYWTGGKLGDCRIRVVYKMRDFNDNSGVFIRIPIEPREEWMPVNYGYEVQIDNHPEDSNEDDYHVTGTLYSLTKPLAKPARRPAHRRGPQRRHRHRLHRRPARPRAEVCFRTAARHPPQ